MGTGILPGKLVTATHGDGVWEGSLHIQAQRKRTRDTLSAAGCFRPAPAWSPEYSVPLVSCNDVSSGRTQPGRHYEHD